MNNEKPQTFTIGTVLTVSHGKLLTDIGNVYLILNYMLDDSLMTHQLPRAGRFGEKFLRAKYPTLSEWDAYSEQITPENFKTFLPEMERIFGEKMAIEKVPPGVWTHKDPFQELEDMIGKKAFVERVITVSTPNPTKK